MSYVIFDRLMFETNVFGLVVCACGKMRARDVEDVEVLDRLICYN